MSFPLHSTIRLLAAVLCFSGSLAPRSVEAAPAAVDLTRQPWFPPVTRQQSFSCSQQVGLYYLLTAEWNQSWQRSAATPSRRFSPYFAYSILSGEANGRSHVVDGWTLAREVGVPLEPDFPRYSRQLMNGYDRYLRAMRNRVKSWDIIPVADDSGISKAKSLLAGGHLLACDFQIKGAVLKALQPSGPRAKERLVTQWGRTGPGHAMVYAGYDDNIGFDINGDGLITNDRDLDGDGKITLADRERGAFLLVNPWGGSWGNGGRAWVPYRLHAVSRWAWSRSVARVEMAAPYQPRLTLRLKMSSPDRQNIIITARNAKGNALQPWMFSHAPPPKPGDNVWESVTSLQAGGPHLSPGPLSAPGGGPLETGHDLTALGRTGSYSLEIRPAKPSALRGEITEAAFLEYNSSGELIREIPVRGFAGKLPQAGGVWKTAEKD